MERILGPDMGDFVRALHEEHGVIFHLGDTVTAIDGKRATLKSGGVIEAELVVVGVGGLLFRTIHLFFIRDVETGLVWMTKIITDPFNDLKLYHKAPLFLMKGELIDPGLEKHVRHA